MKKLLSILLASLMVMALLPVAVSGTEVAATGSVAYLDQGADVETPALNDKDKPYKDFAAAYNALAAAGGGTLMLVETYNITGSISDLTEHSDTIVITAQSNLSAVLVNVNSADNFYIMFAGPVVIENITINSAKEFFLFGNFNPITIGEGVNGNTSKIAIVGGTRDIYTSQSNTNVTVRSGSWRCVVGGSVAMDANAYDKDAKTTTAMNGTFKVTVEGGTITTFMGTNWNDGSNANTLSGGQAYVYVKGGTVTNFNFSGSKSATPSTGNNILVYTGGTITNLNSRYSEGTDTVFYGGNVAPADSSKSGTAFELSATTSNVFICGGKYTKVVCNGHKLDVMPLPEASKTVFLDVNAANNYAMGTETDPVKYLHQAIAMLTYTGGTIKLVGDYEFDECELNGTYQFVEPYHDKLITIDGQGNKIDGSFNVGGLTRDYTFSWGEQSISLTASVKYGYDAYSASGDVTFRNIDITPTHNVEFLANSHSVEYVINTCYSDYIATENAFAEQDVNVTTDIEDLAITFEAFDVGFTDEDKDSLKLRARYSIDDMFFDNEDYNIVEMGVLVKLASFADEVTYIKGANGYYYAPVTIGGNASTENYSGNIAKSVSYVQNAEDATKSAVANYQYDGQSPVVFTAPVVDIKLANGGTKFTFVPYVVLHNADKSDYQVFYGAENSASVLDVAEAILNDVNGSVSDKELAQSIKTAISGGYGE